MGLETLSRKRQHLFVKSRRTLEVGNTESHKTETRFHKGLIIFRDSNVKLSITIRGYVYFRAY